MTHVPPVIPRPTYRLRYTDAKGFSRLMSGASQTELEKALEGLIREGKATLVGAIFYEDKKGA